MRDKPFRRPGSLWRWGGAVLLPLALICLFELQTAFAGELRGLNAFDQPGVEEGKKATYALLGKPGFAAKKAELDAMPARDMRYQV